MASHLPSVSDLLVGKPVIAIPVSELQKHPDNTKHFGQSAPDDDKKLDEDIAERGQTTPLIIVGHGGELPFGMVLGGNRRFESLIRNGIGTAKAIAIDGIDRATAEMVLLCDNLAVDCARRLNPFMRYVVIEKLREALDRRRGQRSDLTGSEKGETEELIAKKAGMKKNEVKELTKVFASPVTPPSLKEAVTDGRISVSRGAAMVRDIEMKRTTAGKVHDIAIAVAPLEANSPRRLKEKMAPPAAEATDAETADDPTVSTVVATCSPKYFFRSMREALEVFQRATATVSFQEVAATMRSICPPPRRRAVVWLTGPGSDRQREAARTLADANDIEIVSLRDDVTSDVEALVAQPRWKRKCEVFFIEASQRSSFEATGVLKNIARAGIEVLWVNGGSGTADHLPGRS